MQRLKLARIRPATFCPRGSSPAQAFRRDFAPPRRQRAPYAAAAKPVSTTRLSRYDTCLLSLRRHAAATSGGDRMGRCFVLAILAVVGANTLALAQTLKREPPMGSLREGQRVLVDDGSCGSGKIKEVVGGNHVT